MARHLLDSRAGPGLFVPAPASSTSTRALTPAQLLDRLRQRRTTGYVAAMSKLDAGAHATVGEAVEQLKAALDAELAEIGTDQFPIGLVGRCYLGAPYQVHTLDRLAGIVEHYKAGQSLPSELERARALAVHPGYAFIEVYRDRLVAVAADGTTSVVER